MRQYQSVIRYLNGAINTFKKDPPNTPYQQGYLEALKEIRRVVRDMIPAKEVKK